MGIDPEKRPLRPYSDAKTDKALALILFAVVVLILAGFGLALLFGWRP